MIETFFAFFCWTFFTRPLPGTANLFAVFERPWAIAEKDQHDVTLWAIEDERRKAPDVVVPTADRIYAIWYALEGRYVTLEADSAVVFLPSSEVVLSPGEVASFRGALRSLPNLDVSFLLPTPEPVTGLALEVTRQADDTRVRRVELEPEATGHLLEHLPPEPLRVALEMPPWAFYERVDLSDGIDGNVFFQPEAVVVEGTVYRGDEGVPAAVVFRANPRDPRQELRVATDEEGAYEAVLYRTGYYVIHVQPEGWDGPAFLEYTEEPIRGDMTLDFFLPASRYRARVVDAVNGRGVAGAEVIADNEFNGGENSVSQRSHTGEDGVAELPLLRPGRLEVEVKASGYLRSQKEVFEVGEDDEEHEIVLRLRPVEAKAQLELLLADGRPAAGAAVRLYRTLEDVAPTWEGHADGEGLVTAPSDVDAELVLVSHPEAGPIIRRSRLADGGSVTTWRLPARAIPLDLRVVDPAGNPVRGASLAVWIDGWRVSGSALAFLTGAWVAGTNVRGTWRAERLPAAPVRVLAWSPGSHRQALTGLLDSLAVDVPYPWPSVVDVPIAD